MLATGISHMARDSILSDGSLPEDLLAQLRDFPHVPDKVLLHTGMLPPITPIIYQDGHHLSGRDSPNLPSLVIDTTPETVFPCEEEGDAAKDFLDASRILRGHPGLVMEHYDPTTSVHTFKIVCPRRHQDESPRLSSPSTPCLSISSRNSSPLASALQTPQSGPLRRLGSVSSRERLGPRTAIDASDRLTYPSSSSASEFPMSVPRPLRRAASELSQRRPSMGTRYMSRRLHQDLPPTVSPPLPQPSSSTISSALDEPARGSAFHTAGASHEREATSGSDLHSSDARWSPDVSITSSDQLLAFRESLARRAQDVSTEARSCVTSSNPHQHHPGLGDLCEDVASDCSDYGESILSGRENSLDEPDNLGSADDTPTSEDLWRTLSITREMRTRDSPDNYSLLANDDTCLDVPARSSSPMSMSQLQPESPQLHIDPHPQRTGSRSPAPTVSIAPEVLQEFLPNFLDLRLGVDMTGSVIDGVSSGADDLHSLQDGEHHELVPEGSSADARRLEGERPDIKIAQQPSTSHGLRKVQSAAELVSSHSLPTRPPPSQDNHRAHDKGTGAQAECSELAHSPSKTVPDNLRRENSYHVKRAQDRRARDGQHPNPGLSVAVDSTSQPESRPKEVFSVSKRHRAMTLQEVSVTGTSISDRLHRSASTKVSAPSPSSFRPGGRYRTLEDRAFRHPDVPHSPLFSELEHGPSAQDAYYTGPSLREPSSGHNPQVSSPVAEHIRPIHSRNPSSSEVYSRNASPRPPLPQPHIPPSHSRNGSYPARKRLVQGSVHRPGTSLDSHAASSLTAISPPSTQGVGLSVIDNGAFEAPRPAPEPRAVTQGKVNVPSGTVVRRVGSATAAEEPTGDGPKRDSDSVISLSLTGLSGFPRRVWSKRLKQPPPRSDAVRRRLGAESLASSSELDLRSSSFMSMVENEHNHVKPQRKGLLLFKWK